MQLKCKFRLCIPKIYAENKSCIRKEEKEEGKRIHRNKRDKIYAGGGTDLPNRLCLNVEKDLNKVLWSFRGGWKAVYKINPSN